MITKGWMLRVIIHILGGGPTDFLPDLTRYNGSDVVWVGVDRGVYTLLTRDIIPTIAFGDFDSVTKGELVYIENIVAELKKFKPEKDETDMEYALKWAINQNPSIIRVFGATGGRFDHTFGNIQLLIDSALHHGATEIEMVDNQNIIFVKSPGTFRIRKIKDKIYTSFLPISSDVKGLTLKGFKYSLTDRHIPLGSTLCISNELINEYGTFSFLEGILMIVRSTD